MKFLLITASAVAALCVSAPAFAQSIQGYGTLGYTDDNTGNNNLGAVTGRIGGRFDRYLGVEGEGGVGVGSDGTSVGGLPANAHLNDEYGAYAVGFLPITPHFDLLGRVGWGAVDSRIHQDGLAFNNHDDGLAFGGGAQYFFDHANGIRADYTRQDYGPLNQDSNVWSLAYVRRF